MLHRRRFADADQPPAAVYPPAKPLDEPRILPYLTARESGVRIAGIDHYVDGRIDALLQHLIEADEYDVHAHAAQGFQDPIVGISLFAVKAMGNGKRLPRPQRSPAV
ncbi:hypothetical protein D3C74_286270 [compost metagenome]